MFEAWKKRLKSPYFYIKSEVWEDFEVMYVLKLFLF